MDQLVRLWQSRLWSVAVARSSDHDAAWDVSQEAWLRILRGLRGLREVEAFGRWATQIVANVAAQRVRRQQVNARAIDKISDRPAAVEADHEKRFERNLLSALPDSQRTIIVLHYFEEMGVADIADMLDIPTGTVKSRLHYARKKLQELLGDRYAKQ